MFVGGAVVKLGKVALVRVLRSVPVIVAVVTHIWIAVCSDTSS